MAADFILGISYWPRRKGLAWWRAFDAGEVREEFAHIRSLGLSLVRFGLLWHEFQPEADRLNHRMLDRLGVVLDVAEDTDLRALPVLFTGYAAGALWYPDWALEEGTPTHASPRLLVNGREVRGYRVKDFYEDKGMLEAQRRFLRETVGYYAGHPAIWGWGLSDDPERARLARAAGAAEEWLGTLAACARELAPDARLAFGLGQDSLTGKTALRLDHLTELCNLIALHVHPGWSAVAEDPLDADFVLYALTLARALSGQAPFLGSLGIGTVPKPGDPGTFLSSRTTHGRFYLASETEQAEYMEKVLAESWRAGMPGAWVMTYADAPEAQWEEPPFDEAVWERTAGVVRRDGTEKPAAETLRRFARRLQREETRPPASGRKLEVDPDEYYRDPAAQFARLYQVYREGGH
jgi:endo-1,4-beta-mannosidase